MVRRHMCFGGAVLIRPAVQPHMETDAIPSKEYLYCIPSDAHIHFLSNVLIRDGVIHFLHGNVVVRADCGDLLHRQFERAGRKRLDEWLLVLKQKRLTAILLLERLVDELLQLFKDSLIQLTQRQELPVAQRCQDKCGDDTHGTLHHGLVLGRTHAAGNDSGVVILCQFLIGLVQHHLAAAMFLHADLQIVTLQYPGHAAEVAKCVDVRGGLAFLVHGEEALHIAISAVRQHRYEHVNIQNLAVMLSMTSAVSPAQSTCMISPGLWFRCMVALCLAMYSP